MTFDQMVGRTAEPAAPAEMQPASSSTTSFLQWCVLDISGKALICPDCDVSWKSGTGDDCWVCGQPGHRVRDLPRA